MQQANHLSKQKKIQNYADYNGLMNNLRDSVYEILGDPEKYNGFHKKDLFFWMTRECNSCCRYCYQGSGANKGGVEFAEAEAIIDMFMKDGFYVHPIVNEWLPAYWPYLRLLKKCGIRQISTNGIVIHERCHDFLPLLAKAGIESIRITLFPEKHHKYYTNRERYIALEAIRLAKNHGFSVVVNYLVTKDTFAFMKAGTAEAADLGADEIFFQNFINTSRAKQLSHVILDSAGIIQFWEVFNQLQAQYEGSSLRVNMQGNFGPNPNGDNIFKRAAQHGHYCIAGIWKHMDHIYVTPDKKIFPCVMLTEPEFQIGEIFSGRAGYAYRFFKTEWESRIPGFDRSNCASLMHMQQELLGKSPRISLENRSLAGNYALEKKVS